MLEDGPALGGARAGELEHERGAASDCGIQCTNPVGDHHAPKPMLLSLQEVELLDEHVETGPILMVRLEFRATEREIVGLGNDEEPVVLANLRLRLREGVGDTSRELAHHASPTDVGRRLKHHHLRSQLFR
nr:hypothetical protein [Hyalangium gracile]